MTRISGLPPISSMWEIRPQEKEQLTVGGLADSFGSVLDRSLKSITTQEKSVERLTEQLATGELTNVHSVLIASEQLALTIQLTTQVRNKAVEAYQEIMRMQL